MNISVCMAVFNGEKYLKEQIESILIQLEEGDELILYDDCSTDSSLDLLKKYAEMQSNIILLDGECNKGVICAFSKALQIAKKEIIVLSDQDDIWCKDKLKATRDIFINQEVIGYLHNANVINSEGSFLRKFYTADFKCKFSVCNLFYSNFVIGCCLAFRREIVKTILPIPSFVSMHDWWIASNIIRNGLIIYDEKILIKYRRHSSNVSPEKSRSIINIAKSRVFNLFALILLEIRIRAS